jgi:hypothetical protein
MWLARFQNVATTDKYMDIYIFNGLTASCETKVTKPPRHKMQFAPPIAHYPAQYTPAPQQGFPPTVVAPQAGQQAYAAPQYAPQPISQYTPAQPAAYPQFTPQPAVQYPQQQPAQPYGQAQYAPQAYSPQATIPQQQGYGYPAQYQQLQYAQAPGYAQTAQPNPAQYPGFPQPVPAQYPAFPQQPASPYAPGSKYAVSLVSSDL